MLNQFVNWYWNEDLEKRKFILWEILKEVRSHSTDMINVDEKIHKKRFQAIGNFHYLMSTFVPTMFVNRIEEDGKKTPIEHPYWNWFRSIQHIRLTHNGEKADIQKDFDKLTYGWDLIIDLDNKHFKYWIKGKELTTPLDDIWRQVVNGVQEPYQEAMIIKDYLDGLKVPLIINFSGSGFRIAIYWEELKNCFSADDYGIMNRKLGEFIVKEAFKGDKAKTFDTSTLGFGLGVTHAMWTLHPITQLVRYPLTDDELTAFSIDMFKPETILGKIGNELKPSAKPYNLKRNGDLSELYAQFSKKTDIDKHTLEKEKKVVKIELAKNEAIEILKKLSNKDREEVIMRIKHG